MILAFFFPKVKDIDSGVLIEGFVTMPRVVADLSHEFPSHVDGSPHDGVQREGILLVEFEYLSSESSGEVHEGVPGA